MPKISSRIREKRSTTINIKDVFRNEDGAIDLASIMVGIIVIGLIGGVIAATVFAVIPWSQDNAAKHQLDSIHSAQNAHFGLVSDPSRTLLTGEERNSFASSAILASSSLLTAGASFCTEPADGGKDYSAYSKSSSGKIFISKNSDKKAVPFTGEITGDCSFITDDSTSESSTPEPEVPAGPVASEGYEIVDYWDFETDKSGVTPVGWVSNTSHGYTYTHATWGHEGTKAMYGKPGITTDLSVMKSYKHLLVNGTTYKVTAWVKPVSTSVNLTATLNVSSTYDINNGNKITLKANEWQKVEIEVTGTGLNSLTLTGRAPSGTLNMYVDELKLEKKLP